MSVALSAGVTGLQAHQKMIDISGNNLANVNTTAYKSSRITFSELLSETIRKASQPTATVGGTNPQQMGSGVGVSGIDPNMSQGNIVSTGNALDMAIEGEGYFVLSDGSQDIYSRAGAFAVDADSYLVDPSTGYQVQRIGSVGESDNFQKAGVASVKVPYDVQIAASATTIITVAGNLSADNTLATPQTNVLTSEVAYTVNTGTSAAGTDTIASLDQVTGTITSGTLTFSGLNDAGTSLALITPAVDLSMSITDTTKLSDVIAYLNTDDGTKTNEVQTIQTTDQPDGGDYTISFGGQTTNPVLAFGATAATIEAALEGLTSIGTGNVSVTGGPIGTGADIVITFQGTLANTDVGDVTIDGSNLTTGGNPSAAPTVEQTTTGVAMKGVLSTFATASISGGRLRITDTASGYSQSDFNFTYTDSGSATLETPGYFEVSTVGGDEIKTLNITVYDTQGGSHVLSGAFVRTGDSNTWDMVLTSITGDINAIAFGDRRIKDIEFNANDGSYSGLDTGTGDTAQFTVTFDQNASNPQTMALTLGDIGELNGLTQFAGNSTAVARDQDGYESGSLSSVSVNNEGILIGAFSNGIKKNIATLKISLFQNSGGLESIGGGYFTPSANSGTPIETSAMTGGAGTIHGGSLEKSNSDVATEFVNMIQAQNGFQANARTIRVANDILRELTSLIR